LQELKKGQLMNAEVFVRSKISRPPIAKGFYCTELHDLLDELRSKQLIVISGPQGIGKSTLVSTYIESRNLLSIWCLVDKSDCDPQNFFNCLDIGVHEAKPHDNFALPHFRRTFSQRIDEFAKLFFQQFYLHLEVPFLIVLDDYQEIAEDSDLHDALRAACTELPKGGRIVIITREKCPPSLAQLRAQNMVAIIESQDFQMTPSKVMPSPPCTD
jgi:LuxR family maltose regulon positive regulatory protein